MLLLYLMCKYTNKQAKYKACFNILQWQGKISVACGKRNFGFTQKCNFPHKIHVTIYKKQHITFQVREQDTEP